jgi:outer membrane protein insertion porin family
MSKYTNGSRWSNMRRIFILSVAWLLIYFHLAPPVFPKIKKETLFVSKVQVKVDGESSPETKEDLISIREGDPFSLKMINSAIKRIYKTELFSDVRVVKEGNQAIELTFLLTTRLFVRSVDMRSKEKIPHKKLKESMSVLTEGGGYSEAKLNRAMIEIEEAFQREGYYDPDIRPVINRLPGSSEIDVIFEIGAFKKYIVSEISFVGDLILTPDELRDEMKTEVKEEYVPSVLEEDIAALKELYTSEDYRRAVIELKDRNFDEERGTVALQIEIVSNEKIEIVVEGADVPLNLLKPIWEANIFEEWGLAEGEAKIVVYMREKGYLFSTVTSRIDRSPNRMRVVYEVNPGTKQKIGDIAFEGLSHFTPTEIKDALLIRSSIPIFGNISGARLYELPREIEFLYNSEGFPDVKVNLVFEREGKTVKPIFQVEEGRQETIQTLLFNGALLFSEDELLSQISAFEGSGFFQPEIQKDLESLEIFYLNSGVRGTKISADIQQEDKNEFTVIFQIEEGELITIERIVITGNKTTRTSTIEREVRLKENEIARYNLIQETERRLENLGIFTEVNIEEIPISSMRENLLIRVREGNLNYASVGLGMETKSQPQTFAIWNNELRPRGTAEYIRSNIFGIAAQVSLVGQLSLRERRIVFSYEQPYFFKFPFATYVNAWLEQEQRTSFSFDRRGIQLGVIKPISSTEDMDLLTTLGYERTKLTELFVLESELDRRFIPYSKTSVAESFIWDRRNDPFNPRQGFFLSSVLEWAYPLFNSESDFLKMFSKYQHFIPLTSQFTLSTTARMGLGRGRIPIHERFFAGGSNSFRGTRFDELGPKDPITKQPIGGKALIILNIEFTFPLLPAFKDLYGAIFYDTGNVWERRKLVSLSTFQNTLGMGLRYRTPLGPIRLELAWYVDAPQGEEKFLGQITIGNVF